MKRGRVILFFLFFILCSLTFICASVINDSSEGDFSGTYNNTFYNSSGFIQVNSSSTNTVELFGNESGIVAYWRFNESSWDGTSGEVKEVVGNNDGTSASGADTTTGLFDRAGSYDGVNDRVRVVDASELNPEDGNYTITGWAYSKPRAGGAANQWQLYVAKRTTSGSDGYYLGLNQGSGINFMVGDGTNRYDTRDGTGGYASINYNEWFHFAGVIDRSSSEIRLYINGALESTRGFGTLGSIGNTYALTFGLDEGQIASQGGYPVNGSVDEVSFWDKALTLSEIQDLYNNGNTSTLGTGTYVSDSKDAGAVANWTNISWNGGISIVENGKANSLLMHLDGNADDENGVNDGTVNGATNVSGKVNYAYNFDGTDDYINIADDSSLDFTSSFSLGAWVNIDSFPGTNQWEGIITKGGDAGDGGGEDHNYFLAVDQIAGWGPGVGIVFGYENSAGTNYQTRYQIDSSYIGQWLHLVGVYNDSGDTMTLYINGTQVSQITSATGTPNTQNLQTLIGRNIDGTASLYYFDGIIDEVFIGDSALSLSEIQDIYNDNDYDSTSGGSSDLKFQIQTSDDGDTWSNWSGPSGDGSYYTSPADLVVSSRYIKYRTFFENLLAKLYYLVLEYESTGAEFVTVTLDSPADNYLTNAFSINASCSASSNAELSNITLYQDFTGWQAQETKNISGTSNTTTFTFVDVTSGNHKWNCYVCNVNGTCSFASSNRTIIIDSDYPLVILESPNNDSVITNTRTPEFEFNVTDDLASSFDCDLWVDNGSTFLAGKDNDVSENVITGITSNTSLIDGNYSWWVNCSDGVNIAMSEKRTLSIQYNDSQTPLWARANTHTHTTNSDGDSSPSAVIAEYKSQGYDLLFITDHNYLTSCYSVYTNLSENFMCLDSEEWTTSTGHMTRHRIDSTYNPSGAYAQEAIDEALADNGFAVLAHPDWTSGAWWDNTELNTLKNYTAIEIYNKKIEVLTSNNYAQTYALDTWDTLLENGSKAFGVASDDMHALSSEAGYGWTKVYIDNFTREQVVDRYKEGYFYASTGPSMDEQPFELTCDESTTYHMGEEANCTDVSFSAKINASQGETVENISLIKNGSIIASNTSCSAQECTFDYSEFNVSGDNYYRLEAIDTAGKYAWSNPIWVLGEYNGTTEENKTIIPVNVTLYYPELVEIDVNGTTVYLNLTIDLNLNMSV